ncbi:Nitrogen assimilation regulatory protein Nac [Sinomonas atrocyanea]|uniref:Nitrogen assimilation regulatory protein Nac n=1 Tax=Sinomonas atrocyanea TaxID=37927 RepID=A0A127A1L7_9MICC|nr:LysR substrate-binding domain-containing protein [Sinomonas atrocyanea]AMM32781.1 Nitrogen assimilation regulatory protein Nac [Sinomonas atrocyanea]GEB66439.1 LysR family transcriptional regulator [Sinomonas atrocyanea]GGG72537.1 LysR family transcriptional regulator [Sinomonas atrocyanea]
MDTRKLEYFVRIVDAGSITRAASALHVAQPALSQQVSALEKDLKQRLLIRSKQGVEPTAAGTALYRHAQTILRLVEEARQDVATSGDAPAGRVSIAMAPYCMASSLAPTIVREVGQRYPDITLHLTEIFGGVLSEAIKNGRLDMALIYEPRENRGIRFTPMIVEDLYLVANAEAGADPEGKGSVTLREALQLPLFLPEDNHTIRRLVDKACGDQGLALRLAGEIESVPSLYRLLQANLGATVLPRSAADALFPDQGFTVLRIVDPALQVKLGLCTADHEPMSEAAAAVLILLREMIKAQLLTRYGMMGDQTLVPHP